MPPSTRNPRPSGRAPGASRTGLPLSGRRLALVALVIALIAVLAVTFRDTLTFEALRDNRDSLISWRDRNYSLAALGYLLAYIAVVALSLPGATIMTLGGGFLFGLLPATILTVFAATAGATLLFLLAKAGFGDALHARITAGNGDSRLRRIEAGLRENAFSYLLTLRLVPAFPFFLVNLAPAFLGVSLRTYVVATFLGIIPGTAVYAWIGAGLGEVFARGETPDLSLIFDPIVLGPLIGLAALALLPVILKHVRGRSPAE